MEEVYPDIYRKVLEFPGTQQSPRNLYIVKQSPRSLMVDTSLRTDEGLKAIDDMMRELKINYCDLDVFITHIHPDHAGLAEEMKAKGATIYMNPEEENPMFNLTHCYMVDIPHRIENLQVIGVTKEGTPDVFQTVMQYTEEMARQNLYGEEFPYIPIEPGQTLHYGTFAFKVVSLRGHTYGQLGLCDSTHKVFFCADQLMTTISPIVGSMKKDMSMLEYYMESLDILKHYYGDYLMLSSHYDIIHDVASNVNRIAYSYIDKCNIMEHILEHSKTEMTVRQVGVRAYGRDEGAPEKKKFSSCMMIWLKTFSCLEYLYHKGFIQRIERDGTLYWSK